MRSGSPAVAFPALCLEGEEEEEERESEYAALPPPDYAMPMPRPQDGGTLKRHQLRCLVTPESMICSTRSRKKPCISHINN